MEQKNNVDMTSDAVVGSVYRDVKRVQLHMAKLGLNFSQQVSYVTVLLVNALMIPPALKKEYILTIVEKLECAIDTAGYDVKSIKQ